VEKSPTAKRYWGCFTLTGNPASNHFLKSQGDSK
jgi:hypothetical protein